MTNHRATIWTLWATVGLVLIAALPLGYAAVSDRTTAVEALHVAQAQIGDHETRLRTVEGDLHGIRADIAWLRQIFENKQAKAP